MKLVGVIFASMLVTMLSSPASTAETCESLSSLSVPDTRITMAQTVAAGALTLPTPVPAAGPRGGHLRLDEGPSCRVSAVIKPSTDSEKLECEAAGQPDHASRCR